MERGPAGSVRRTRGCAVLQQESRHANLALLRRHVQRLDPEGGGLRDRRAGFQESLGDLGASPFGCWWVVGGCVGRISVSVRCMGANIGWNERRGWQKNGERISRAKFS